MGALAHGGRRGWGQQAFRFNGREGRDADRFKKALGSVAGRRLTYFELTGKAATSS